MYTFSRQILTPQGEESVLPIYEAKSHVIVSGLNGLNLDFDKLQSNPPYDTSITTSSF